jgi:hypothetical protein
MIRWHKADRACLVPPPLLLLLLLLLLLATVLVVAVLVMAVLAAAAAVNMQGQEQSWGQGQRQGRGQGQGQIIFRACAWLGFTTPGRPCCATCSVRSHTHLSHLDIYIYIKISRDRYRYIYIYIYIYIMHVGRFHMLGALTRTSHLDIIIMPVARLRGLWSCGLVVLWYCVHLRVYMLCLSTLPVRVSVCLSRH